MIPELIFMYVLYKLDQSSRESDRAAHHRSASSSHDVSEYDQGWGSFDPGYDAEDYGYIDYGDYNC